ncbi:diacylglycerol kinase family protein [Paraglaciecola aestuariivivens]
MRFSYYYLISAGLILIAAWYTPNIFLSLILFWIGASVGAVAFAYVFKRPQIFRKKHDGSIPFYIRWLFVPFLLGAQVYNAWARKQDSVPAIQKIDHNLYLACRLFPADIEELKRLGVRAILDVTAEFDGLDWSAYEENLHYLNVPVLDHQSPTEKQIRLAINWLDNQTKKHAVVIHCALGRGRSVFVMAAYLLKKHPQWNVAKALETIHGVRRTARLNRKQLSNLKKVHQGLVQEPQAVLAIIANPISGGGKWQVNKDEIVQRLSVKYSVLVFETQQHQSAKSLTLEALQHKPKVVVACGGDGTLAEVAAQLLDTQVVFGMIAMGTTNALCHAIYGTGTKVYPVALCCDAILYGQVQSIDTAKCNDQLMLLMASIGFGQQMIASAGRAEKDQSGQMAYLKGLFKAVQNGQIYCLTLSLDNQAKFEVQTTSLVVANAAPFSTVLAQGGGGPSMTDGRLDITWLPAEHDVAKQVFNLADLAISGITGEAANPDICFKQAQNIQISSSSPISYMLDGEERQAEALNIEVLPKSLKVATQATIN